VLAADRLLLAVYLRQPKSVDLSLRPAVQSHSVMAAAHQLVPKMLFANDDQIRAGVGDHESRSGRSLARQVSMLTEFMPRQLACVGRREILID